MRIRDIIMDFIEAVLDLIITLGVLDDEWDCRKRLEDVWKIHGEDS